MTDIGVIGGAGYVGLVTGVGLAALGHKVISMDLDQSRIKMLREGKSAVYEEGLEPMLSELIHHDQISFTDNQSEAVRNADVLFIAVGTPSLADGAADLSAVIAVAERLREEIRKYTVIVVKSTVPVGTISVITEILSQKLTEFADFDVAICRFRCCNLQIYQICKLSNSKSAESKGLLYRSKKNAWVPRLT